MTEVPVNPPSVPSSADPVHSQDQVALFELVGEGKKFKTVEDLAKGKIEADNFIVRLQQEQAELRAELAKRTTMEQVMESILSSKPVAPVVPVDPTPVPSAPPASEVTPKTSSVVPSSDIDMENKVKAIIAEREAQSIVSANRAATDSALIAKFGTVEEAKKVVAEKAAGLGVSVEFLQSVADKSPNALMSMLGLTVNANPIKPSSNTSPASINPVANGVGAKSGVEAELEALNNLRRTKPNEYFLPRNQQRMMELNVLVRKGKS